MRGDTARYGVAVIESPGERRRIVMKGGTRDAALQRVAELQTQGLRAVAIREQCGRELSNVLVSSFLFKG